MEFEPARALRRLLCILGSLLYATAQAQTEPFPSKPMRLIIPYPPGATVDLTARAFAARLSGRFGQQLVADNIGGAGGVIAAETAARSQPNGHTLFFGTPATMVIAPLLNRQLSYNPARDFDPVSQLVSNPLILVIHAGVGARTPAELIALAKGSPGKLNFGSAGSGTPSHIALELFRTMADIDIVHVPYKGGAQAQVDLVSGRLQIYAGSIPGLLPNIKAGKLRPIGITTPRRSSTLPEVPPLLDTVPGYEFDTWSAIFVAAKTPAALVARINEEIGAVVADSEFSSSLARQGSEARASTPQALGAIVRNETERLRKVIAAIGPISQ